MPDKNLKCIAFIPARSGSRRIPAKNIRILDGHPLVAYTIAAALKSKVFDRVIVSTDSEEIKDIALKYGAEVPFLRPAEYAADYSADIEWITHLLNGLKELGELPDCFSILRPTSPFRQPETIIRAWRHFLQNQSADSLRAMEKCSQHPAKMWVIKDGYAEPLMKNPSQSGTPWHSQPYQNLPEIHVQNASLEIAWATVPFEKKSIAGDKILHFITEGYEGFDLNYPEDWIVAEYIIKNDLAKLPSIDI